MISNIMLGILIVLVFVVVLRLGTICYNLVAIGNILKDREVYVRNRDNKEKS